jgi:hypothetical protein
MSFFHGSNGAVIMSVLSYVVMAMAMGSFIMNVVTVNRMRGDMIVEERRDELDANHASKKASEHDPTRCLG